MKQFALALVLLAAGSAPVLAQSVLAGWNFDSATASGTSTSYGPIAADIGFGSASATHASAATWSTPAGNGSARSFSANTWAVGDYFQFQLSTVGSSGISVSWDQTGSGTGPKDFKLQYSTNGTTWTDHANYSPLINASPNATWSSLGSRNAAYTFSFDLSAVTALDNQSAAYFRLTDTSTTSLNNGTVATAGTDRVDNFSVTAIPEPSTYALILSLTGFGFAAWRRHARPTLAAGI